MLVTIAGLIGGSGSGKTTLAHGLCGMASRFGSAIVSQDQYYKGLPEGIDASRHLLSIAIKF